MQKEKSEKGEDLNFRIFAPGDIDTNNIHCDNGRIPIVIQWGKKLYVMAPNVLNMWNIYIEDKIPEDFKKETCTEITQDFKLYTYDDENIENVIFLHKNDFFDHVDENIFDTDYDNYDENSSLGSDISETIEQFHEDARLFDEWEPQTPGEKLFKDMVTNLENRYKRRKHNH
jgi:hypothetical protein